MFGLPVVLAALALNGASASLPVRCNPDTTAARHAEGLTYFVPGTATPTGIEFSGTVCAGLLWLAASPTERVAIGRLNSGYNFDHAAGVALIVVLHETRHGAGDRDEAHTECVAVGEVDAFAQRVAPVGELLRMLAYAHDYDRALPASFHGASC